MEDSRIKALTPAELDVEQQALYDSIVTGPRAQGPQLFALQDDEGRLNGLRVDVARARTRFSAAGTRECGAISDGDDRPDQRNRDTHGRCRNGERVRTLCPRTVGHAVGLSAEETTALRSGEFRSEDPTEQAAYDVCRHLLAGANTLGDEDFRRFEAGLGHSALLELVVLVGYYRTLSQMMNVFGVGAPAGLEDE